MRPHIKLSVPLRSLRIGALVMYNGDFYLRGFSSRANGIQLSRMEGNFSIIEYVPHDTLVHHCIGYSETYAGYGLPAL